MDILFWFFIIIIGLLFALYRYGYFLKPQGEISKRMITIKGATLVLIILSVFLYLVNTFMFTSESSESTNNYNINIPHTVLFIAIFAFSVKLLSGLKKVDKFNISKEEIEVPVISETYISESLEYEESKRSTEIMTKEEIEPQKVFQAEIKEIDSLELKEKPILTNPIIVICPNCKTEKTLQVPCDIINQSKQLTTVSVNKGLSCEHGFQVFIDKNFKVRGYQKVDFDFDENSNISESVKIKTKKKEMSNQEIYNEFWELIDDENEEFQEFILEDQERREKQREIPGTLMNLIWLENVYRESPESFTNCIECKTPVNEKMYCQNCSEKHLKEVQMIIQSR